MSSRGEIETENKQSVDNCLLDRFATVDSRLVREILCTRDCIVLLQRDVVSVSRRLRLDLLMSHLGLHSDKILNVSVSAQNVSGLGLFHL